MLRAHAGFELHDPGWDRLYPAARHYQVVEQPLELPLWKVQVLPQPGLDDNPDGSRLWRSFVSSSVHGVLQVVSTPDWEQVSIHVVLPEHMGEAGTLQLARCTAIWGGCSVENPKQASWVFETDCGTFVDPATGLCSFDEVRVEMLVWGVPVLQLT